MVYKQIIIARKDLNMSPGKLAAQVSHASMAFLTSMIRKNAKTVLDVNIGRAWKWEPPKHGETIEQAQERIRQHPEERKPQPYKRIELYKWAQKARANNQEFFYYKAVDPNDQCGELMLCDKESHIESTIAFDNDLFDNWINGSFTKIVLQAHNRNQLLKAIELAKANNMQEGIDFFLIKDNCYTELTPEETDENGIGRTLTCIGFKPMNSEIIDIIAKKYHIYT